MATHRLVENVLSDSSLIISNISYTLKEIYEIVEANAGLRPQDYKKEDNGDIKWKHAVRTILGRRYASSRTVIYHTKRRYSFV